MVNNEEHYNGYNFQTEYLRLMKNILLIRFQILYSSQNTSKSGEGVCEIVIILPQYKAQQTIQPFSQCYCLCNIEVQMVKSKLNACVNTQF